MGDPLLTLAVLCANLALAEWLVRRTPLRHLGSALLVIVLTSIGANAGLIPTFGPDEAVYNGIFEHVAPMGIFWLLLRVDLKDLARAGPAMIGLFLLGSAGTVLGVLAGMAVVGGAEAFGDRYHALGGMFVGTYTGGSVNFNAVALEYGVVESGPLFAGAAVVDSAMTTLWMAATVAIPRALARVWPGRRRTGVAVGAADLGIADDTESLHPLDVGVTVALGAAALWGSRALAELVGVHSVVVLTTVALVLAQLPAVKRLRGPRTCGMVAVLLFLAVIGALCDVAALRELGDLGGVLALFVFVVVAVHGALVFGVGALCRADVSMVAVCSQANVGGGTSALALARSLGRADLVLPAVLVGTLGMAIGTYLGFSVAEWLE